MTRGVEERLAQAFVCARCKHKRAHVQRLSLIGAGVALYRYVFVSCTSCGYTDVYNLQVLEESLAREHAPLPASSAARARTR
jgi:predicted nucleic-acid-binding Zn-ribbon protein